MLFLAMIKIQPWIELLLKKELPEVPLRTVYSGSHTAVEFRWSARELGLTDPGKPCLIFFDGNKAVKACQDPGLPEVREMICAIKEYRERSASAAAVVPSANAHIEANEDGW